MYTKAALTSPDEMCIRDRSSLEALEAALPVLEALDDYSAEGVHAAMGALVERLGVKNGWLLWPLRTALSGKAFTPGGGTDLAAILGKQETVSRVKAAIEKLKNE